jgi:hypothetical protein
MADRIIPEPAGRDPERVAEERELARSAHLAGLAVQRATDLGRLLVGPLPATHPVGWNLCWGPR